MGEPNFLTKLKTKWGINNNWQIFIICLVFAITGSSSVRLSAPILSFFGIDDTLTPWLYWPLRVLITFPVYQVLLICIGAIFGQFKFFWNMEKKMLGRFIPRGVSKTETK